MKLLAEKWVHSRCKNLLKLTSAVKREENKEVNAIEPRKTKRCVAKHYEKVHRPGKLENCLSHAENAVRNPLRSRLGRLVFMKKLVSG